MNYFSKVTASHWVAKNRLQQEAQILAHDLERVYFPERELPLFEKELKTRIDELNKQYPRCKSLELEFYREPYSSPAFGTPSYYTSQDLTWIVPGVFHLTLYAVKG